MVKCILFDADGVVINARRFSLNYQDKYGYSAQKMGEKFFARDFQPCLIDEADLKEILKDWIKEFDWNGNVEEFMEFWFESENSVDKRMIDLIYELRNKGVLCVLTTNQEKYRTKFLKNNMGFSEIFDYVFSSADIGFMKPDSDFFKAVLSRINEEVYVRKENIVFVDDSPENVSGGKEFGIVSHFYEDFDSFVEFLKSNKLL